MDSLQLPRSDRYERTVLVKCATNVLYFDLFILILAQSFILLLLFWYFYLWIFSWCMRLKNCVISNNVNWKNIFKIIFISWVFNEKVIDIITNCVIWRSEVGIDTPSLFTFQILYNSLTNVHTVYVIYIFIYNATQKTYQYAWRSLKIKWPNVLKNLIFLNLLFDPKCWFTHFLRKKWRDPQHFKIIADKDPSIWKFPVPK